MPPVEQTDGMSWWLGALMLASVAVGYALVMRRALGGSGAVACAFSLDERRAEREALMAGDPLDDEDALRAATLAAFSEEAIGAAQRAAAVDPPANATTVASCAPPLTWTPHAVFLVFLVVGGFLSRQLPGGLSISSNMPGEFTAWFGSGIGVAVVLAVGGLLVGFGTQMAGGCTTGHGLTGSARLQTGSLVTTATFFGTGIAVSFLLQALLR